MIGPIVDICRTDRAVRRAGGGHDRGKIRQRDRTRVHRASSRRQPAGALSGDRPSVRRRSCLSVRRLWLRPQGRPVPALRGKPVNVFIRLRTRTMTYKGQCFCGTVQIEVSGTPAAMGYCHCRSCRSWSGGPVNAFTLGHRARSR